MTKDVAASGTSRRGFIQKSGLAVAGTALAGLSIQRSAHAAGSDVLKVGLIGCGGRGTGAALNAMRADPQTKITALGDAFPDQIEHCLNLLSRNNLGDRLDVTPERCFTGFDNYKGVIDSGVDVVLLCSPPHFRPAHLRAAIEAGKHVFCEKPIAVDGPGVRHVLESTAMARDKGLNLVSGLCWRYDYGVNETMRRIKEGAIGDIVAIQENYLTGTLWHRGRKPEWSEMEYQMRNWLYFTWLSGDHIAEQHVHSIDKALWLMDDKPPVSCVGLGGRQVRTDPKFGNVFDHFAVYFEWPNGVKAFAYTRQMSDCMMETEDFVLGTKGRAEILNNEIQPSEGDAWKYSGDKPSMYDVEHQALFGAIRSGQTINNGEYMSYSTLMAIMGREACYTGKKITWEQALNSTTVLAPKEYAWGDVDIPSTVATPGVTKFV